LPTFHYLEKCLDNQRVELFSRLVADIGDCLLFGPCFLVRAYRGKRIENIDQPDNARRQRYFLPCDLFRVSLAVVVFMMIQSDFAGQVEQIIIFIEYAAGFFQHLFAFQGVSFDDLALFRIQFPGLFEDAVGNGNLAYIMKNAGSADMAFKFRRDFFRVISQLTQNLHDFIGHDSYAHDVIACILILVFREAGQCDDHGTPGAHGLFEKSVRPY